MADNYDVEKDFLYRLRPVQHLDELAGVNMSDVCDAVANSFTTMEYLEAINWEQIPAEIRPVMERSVAKSREAHMELISHFRQLASDRIPISAPGYSCHLIAIATDYREMAAHVGGLVAVLDPVIYPMCKRILR